jgi:hypothetical protein
VTDNDPRRARALQLLKELVRALVEEVEANGEAVVPRNVAERALQGLNDTDPAAIEKGELLQELTAYVRDLRGR